MFLRKRKYNVRLLKKKHFIDLWGQYKKKKKFHHNQFQRSLLWFSRLVDRALYPPVKIVKNFTYRPRFFLTKPQLYPRDKFGRLDKRSLQYKRPLTFRKILKYYAKLLNHQRPLRSRRILALFNSYLRWKKVSRRRLAKALSPRTTYKWPLLRPLWRWHRLTARKISRVNTRRYRIKPEEFRRIYLRARRNKYVEIVRQQHYYGFNKLKTFLRVFRRFEAAHGSFKFMFGLEGLLSHLLFRCNIAPTVRAAHLLIRCQAVYINNHSRVFTVHRCLNVGDKFGIIPRYIRTIYKLFRKSLKRRLIKINVPNYMEYNYRLMFFFIWRAPTIAERTFLHHAPYKRTTSLKPVRRAPQLSRYN